MKYKLNYITNRLKNTTLKVYDKRDVNRPVFSLNPPYLYDGDYTCDNINVGNTTYILGNLCNNNYNFIESPFTFDGKQYYDAENSEAIEAPVRMENFRVNLKNNQTIQMWLNIKAPLNRKILSKESSNDGVEHTARSKSGNVLYFYNQSYEKYFTVGYKCPYYLFNNRPSNKYIYDNYQFVIGVSQRMRYDRQFIITDYSYQFDTWYLLTYVNDNNSIKLYVNGVLVKIFMTNINLITNFYGNHYFDMNLITYDNIITNNHYQNMYGVSQESYFSNSVTLPIGSSPLLISGLSTGLLNNINARKYNMRKYGKMNPFIDNGLIEIYNRVMTEHEIITYRDITNMYY